MKALIAAMVVAVLASVASAQEVLPDPVWPMTPSEYDQLMSDPDLSTTSKIATWQRFEAAADYYQATASTYLAQNYGAALNDMASSVKTLATAVSNQADAQTRMAIAVEDLVTLNRMGMFPSRIKSAGPVNVNTASVEELMDVVGIGPSLAVSIQLVAKDTPFGSIGDLILIPGMTQSLLIRLAPFLTVGSP